MNNSLRYKMVLAALLLLLCSASAMAELKTVGDYVNTVRTLFKQDKWSQGKPILDEAMQKYGSHTNVNELMGWYYTHYHQWNQARFYLIKSLRDDASTLHSRDLLITVEEETKNYSSALCYLNEQLEYKPYYKGYWRHKIELYRKMNNTIEADRCLKRMKQIFPNDTDVQKDYNYQTELDYYSAKKKGDINASIAALKELVSINPKNSDWYIALSNLYLQQGRVSDAEEITAQGVAATGNETLLRKRVGMMTDRGDYAAAMSFLKNYQREHKSGTATTLYNQMQMEAAEHSKLYDPYIMYGKVFEQTKSQEALDFLLNTSISRAYYDDALLYLKEARKRKGETKDLLYKEYIMYRRMGDKKAASNTLNKLYLKDPHDKDVCNDLAEIKLTQAVQSMDRNDYEDAIPLLTFAIENSDDEVIVADATNRLYNSYLETKNYQEASKLLDKRKAKMSTTHYAMLYSSLLQDQGKTVDALHVLHDAYVQVDSLQDKRLLSGCYEEIAVPYIKALMQRGLIKKAYDAAHEAVYICPKSVDILTQAINGAATLNKKEDYRFYVEVARQYYPDDPFFIVKEAGVYSLDKDYEHAVNAIRPHLETYLGDASMINAYSENSELLSLQLLKKKDAERAMEVIDSALVYDANSKQLLYTKGVIYEKMHMADSAYIYQKHYQPTLMDFQEFKHHLEELQFRGLPNELSFEYQQFRLGAEYKINANAILSYTHHSKRNDYTFTVNYAGRDGATSEYMTADDQESGGQGIQLVAQWQHQLNDSWAFQIGGGWANKFMPRWMVRAALLWDFADGWNLDLHGSWRKVYSYNKRYTYIPNTEDPSWQYYGGDTTYVKKLVGWDKKALNLFQAGVTVTKTMTQFVIAGSADAFLLDNRFFVNGQVKFQFFPVDGNRSHVFASAGAGTAPELTIIDRSLPSTFSNLNSFVSAGGLYCFNKSLAASLSGSWYTMFKQSENVSAIHIDQMDISTSYSNLFFINAKVFIYF